MIPIQKKKTATDLTKHVVKEKGPFSATVEFENTPDHVEKDIYITTIEKNEHSRAPKYQPDWYPWESIKNLFVKGAPDKSGAMHYPTIQELVDYFGVSYSAIQKKMNQEEWFKERVARQRELARLSQEEAVEDLLDTIARFDSTCVQAAQLAMEEIVSYLVEAKADDRHVDMLNLDRLGRAAANWQKVGRLSLNLSTENQASKIEATTTSIQSIDLSYVSEDELALLEKLAMRIDEKSNVEKIDQGEINVIDAG